MRGQTFQIGAIARAAGYVVVASAIAATALHFQHDDPGAPAPLRAPSTGSDPLALELAHCQSIGMAAKDDAACEAAWAENRRRFFTYRPANNAAAAQPTEQNSTARPEGR
jgi:conjugative transfer region protein TrbK